jgi:hypothetical protein
MTQMQEQAPVRRIPESVLQDLEENHPIEAMVWAMWIIHGEAEIVCPEGVKRMVLIPHESPRSKEHSVMWPTQGVRDVISPKRIDRHIPTSPR